MSKRGGSLLCATVTVFDDLTTLSRFFQRLGYPKLVSKVRRAAERTARRQTGEWTTNRQARWTLPEEHPQYASREECANIAAKLLAQVLEFHGAPEPPDEVKEAAARVLRKEPRPGGYYCPISGLPLQFDELVDSTDINPRHGLSAFAIGHMIPLGGYDGQPGRHVAENVDWVHELGNRVQGNLSLDQTVAEIHRMSEFHRRRAGRTS